MLLEELLKHPKLRTIVVGKCATGDRWDVIREAGKVVGVEYAHAHLAGRGKGFICIRDPRRVYRRGSNHAHIDVAHELAHLITGSKGHLEPFFAAMRSLGYRPEPWYRRHP